MSYPYGNGGGYSNPYYQDPYYNNAPPPPAQGYGAPPPLPRYDHQPSYHHLPPPPPPQDAFQPPPEVALDPNAFRRFFMYHLQTLNFNSKPVITNLTLFAHQHLVRMSTVVAGCLEDHLRNCPPEHRLPALYLLDSISKNIGPPYTTHFARFIERSFLSSYHVVDPDTQIKMEELLGTWRTGGRDGDELFKVPGEERGRMGRVQRGIESALFGQGGRGGGIGRPMEEAKAFHSGVQQLPSPANPGERSGVLFDVRRRLQLHQDQGILHPEDVVNKNQIVALKQLEDLIVSTQLTSDQVYQIRQQLLALSPIERSRSQSIEPPPVAARPSPSPAPGVLPDLSAPKIQGIDLNLLAQLKGLAAAGGILNLPKVEEKVEVKPEQVVAQVDRVAKEYDDAILNVGVRLENADLLKPRPMAVAFLYDRLPLQCKQCGLRFLDSKIVKRSMDKHLDWHFTHKRRIREGAGRAQGRSWLTLEEDWMHSDDVDLFYESSSADPSASTSSAFASTSSGTGKSVPKVDRSLLLKKKVVAPTDPVDEAKHCPICKENFKSEWNEEDEEWVFYNAVKVDGTIFHATCHSEATTSLLSSTSRFKLDPDSGRPSRETTPSSAGFPPVPNPQITTPSGTVKVDEPRSVPSSERKRKAEEEQGTPQVEVGLGAVEGGAKRLKQEEVEG